MQETCAKQSLIALAHLLYTFSSRRKSGRLNKFNSEKVCNLLNFDFCRLISQVAKCSVQSGEQQCKVMKKHWEAV